MSEISIDWPKRSNPAILSPNTANSIVRARRHGLGLHSFSPVALTDCHSACAVWHATAVLLANMHAFGRVGFTGTGMERGIRPRGEKRPQRIKEYGGKPAFAPTRTSYNRVTRCEVSGGLVIQSTL
jgi:hypothetical protein